MSGTLFESPVGEFTIVLPASEDWRATVVENSEDAFVVGFSEGDSRLVVQRLRLAQLTVESVEDFEARVVNGAQLALSDILRPMKILERKITLEENGGARADLLVRGQQGDEDVMQRRRLVMYGTVPPNPLIVLSASCPAGRFLVHRRVYEEMFDSFRWTGKKQ